MDSFLALERARNLDTHAELEDCVARLSNVLAVLDTKGVPPEIGARLDEALRSLTEFLETTPTAG